MELTHRCDALTTQEFFLRFNKYVFNGSLLGYSLVICWKGSDVIPSTAVLLYGSKYVDRLSLFS